MNKQPLIASSPVLTAQDLGQSYREAGERVVILKAVSLSVYPKQRIAIVGPSGSGKTTLLHLLGGLAAPTSGQVMIDGHRVDHLPESTKCQIRNQKLGFIYQFHHLLKECTALENVMMPLLIAKTPYNMARDVALQALRDVHLEHRAGFNASRLSGGEKQRVAIARAIVNRPICILADEPTGNLDEQHAAQVCQILFALQAHCGSALVLVTHDKQLTQQMDQVYHMHEGALILDE